MADTTYNTLLIQQNLTVNAENLNVYGQKENQQATTENENEGANRREIDELLSDLIPKSTKSPDSYVGNLLSELKNIDDKITLINGLWRLK